MGPFHLERDDSEAARHGVEGYTRRVPRVTGPRRDMWHCLLSSHILTAPVCRSEDREGYEGNLHVTVELVEVTLVKNKLHPLDRLHLLFNVHCF